MNVLKTLAAVPPVSPRLIPVVVHPSVLNSHLSARNMSAFGQLSGLILRDQVLVNPTALFKGVKRPLHSDGVDNFVFVYVSKPDYTYRFSKWKGKKGVPDTLLAPANSVFVTYVSLTRPVVAEVQKLLQHQEIAFRGTILGWEWVHECPENPLLPINHATRYKKSIWKST
jgi:hypothetical protein